MSMMNDQSQGTGSLADVVTQLKGIAKQLSNWVMAFSGRTLTGNFTLAAAASTVVSQTAVEANSVILLAPTNAAAATLIGSAKSLYYSKQPGTSFTVLTASGASAAGTETFDYLMFTPS